MPIYNKSTKELMHEFAKIELQQASVFTKDQVSSWFNDNYPKIKKHTVNIHVEAMSINNETERKHHNIRKDTNHDLFYKISQNQFRLWKKGVDQEPFYRDNTQQIIVEDVEEGSEEFAYESDLKNYLAKNLGTIEKGLKLYEDDGISGIEYSVGGRRIDILARDKNNDYVVIELKCSRGYDRTIGQILRYMGWIEKHLAENNQKVRGIIIANKITDDLKLATSRIKDIDLLE